MEGSYWIGSPPYGVYFLHPLISNLGRYTALDHQIVLVLVRKLGPLAHQLVSRLLARLASFRRDCESLKYFQPLLIFLRWQIAY